jgi:ribosome-associated protein
MSDLSAEEKTAVSTLAATDKKAMDVVILDMREASSITDYFLLCAGGSERQVQAIADAIDEQMSRHGVASLGVEGYREARWILMDYGDVVVHVFSQDTRDFYDLERLWSNAPKVELGGDFMANGGKFHDASVG